MITLDFGAITAGLIIGLGFGYVISRSRLCSNSAFSNIVLMRNFSLGRILLVSALLLTFTTGILALFGLVTYRPMGFSYLLSPVGGLIFGVGMVLAGGCASGICYKAGEGLYQAIVAIFGFALGGLILTSTLGSEFAHLRIDTTVFNSLVPTLGSAVGIQTSDVWILGIILGGGGIILLGFYSWRHRRFE
ncbi:MAG TPA: YeeE/YedE thiosulfate transporter family protein, partial [Candidatus Hodarchaeales archaeon]|nr:YeeE/YedE thiosulfate transporter family protein [Candidatus Hodarchaeales archaeon]